MCRRRPFPRTLRLLGGRQGLPWMGSSSEASFRSAQASCSGARRQGLGRGDQNLSVMPPNGRAQTHTPGWMGLGAPVTYSKKSFPVANNEDDALGSLWALRRGFQIP
ncbi:p53-regulated apoptosis-inducing protein 1 isoform X6 [Homo sapiens]|uniref:p53-regulated apoptosis-inducing protein 1 isoform X6 n=1 Tax=Homo sapiens TaxID=9606 RepID=UPI001FB19613|nr:p53-regulated apoptosis-inducing protein 1 isoform X6 [Homo sapiens]XP_054225596.1 p53-regulated apoptosis-inducing protein 1 isoform X6 [Homo sapiens]